MKKVSLLNLKIVFTLLLVTSLSFSLVNLAKAQYPEKSINLDIAFTAGGQLDVLVRELFNNSKFESINRNVTGGGGVPALAQLLNAKNDGYNLVAVVSNALFFMPQKNNTPYKPLGDFTPVITFAKASPILISHKDSEIKNIQNITNPSKPQELKVAISGLGTPSHLVLSYLNKQYPDTKFSFIPYAGPGEAEAALLAGHVDLATTGNLQSIKNNNFIALLTLSGQRLASLSEVPSLTDLNLEDPSAADSTFIILAPKDTDPKIITTLEQALVEASQNPNYLKLMEKFSVNPAIRSHDETVKWLNESWDKETSLLMELGIIENVATKPR